MNRFARILLVAAVCGLAVLLWRDFFPSRPAPPPARPVPVIALRFGHNMPTDSALHALAARFAELAVQRSGGRFTVRVHPGQELGNDDQMQEMVRQGELDILLIPTAKLSAAVPAMQYADLPFFFDSRQELYAMLDGEPGRLLLEKLTPIGLVGATFWGNGFKQFTANRPLHAPEDFQGLKIRTMKSRILMDQFEAMGAHPVLVDFHATRQALADGAVDGQENPLAAIVSMGIHQVQTHLTLSNHAYLAYVLVFSAKSLEKLLPQERDMLLDLARELTPAQRDESARREEQLLETVRQAGVQVHELSPEERQRFARALVHLPRQFEPVIGPDLLAKTEELKWQARRAAGDSREILIGLDADLSVSGGRAATAIRRGVLMAMEEINAAGGVLGRPLAMLTRDDRALPTRGVENFREMAVLPEVVAIMGGLFSNIAELQGQEAQRWGVPLLIPWAAAASVVENGQSPNWVFRISANDRLAGPFLADQTLNRFSKVALVLENSIWGRGIFASIVARMTQRGHPPVHVTWFNRGDTSFAQPLAELRQSGAEAILMVANTNEGAAVVQAMREQGISLPIVSHWGIAGGEFLAKADPLPPQLDLTILQTFSFTGNRAPVAARARDLHRRLFDSRTDKELSAPTGTAHAYDLVHLLAKAIAQAGTTDRAAVREALERLGEHPGLVKHYAIPFTPERHDALDMEDYFMARFNANGVLEPVTP